MGEGAAGGLSIKSKTPCRWTLSPENSGGERSKAGRGERATGGGMRRLSELELTLLTVFGLRMKEWENKKGEEILGFNFLPDDDVINDMSRRDTSLWGHDPLLKFILE